MYGVVFMAQLMGCEPDWQKVGCMQRKAMRTKVTA